MRKTMTFTSRTITKLDPTKHNVMTPLILHFFIGDGPE